MSPVLVGGVIVLVLSIIGLCVIVSLAKKRGRALAAEEAEEQLTERRQDADEIIAEPVADEAAWVEAQIRAAGTDPK